MQQSFSQPIRALVGVGVALLAITLFFTLSERPAAAQDGTVSLWKSGKSERLDAAVHDRDPKTYQVVVPQSRDEEIGIGWEWSSKRRLSGFRITYLSLNGNAYEALPDDQSLEISRDKKWERVPSRLVVDYGREREFAHYQKFGLVTWDYRFAPVEAEGLRVVLTRTVSPVRFEQRYVIAEIEAYDAPREPDRPADVLVLNQSAEAHLPGREANWALPVQGGKRSQDEQGTIFEWSRPKILSDLRLALPDLSGAIQWWDGYRWRDLALSRLDQPGTPSTWVTARFLPIATQRLRLVGVKPSVPVEFRATSARDYFNRVYSAGRDMLMERLMRSGEEPDYAGVASLLLPLDMQTAVIGRPGDAVECLVHWNGTIVETENGDQGRWNHGAKGSSPKREPWIDRWLTFAADGELFGSDPDRTSRSYLDGFLPSVVTRHQRDHTKYEVEVFTTAPTDSLYAQVVTARLVNTGNETTNSEFELILGRRLSAVEGRRARGPSASPMNFEPLPTGYRFEADRQTIRNESGEVILYALKPFERKGTALEHALSYRIRLGPRESRELHFLLPSVNQPVRDDDSLRQWDVQQGRDRFRQYWNATLESKAAIDLPEPPLNDLWKNLLAQSLIILQDGDKLKYGAYWYEDYFGVEEGWPVTALAQFGHGDMAKRAAAIMLSPELTDPSNYHHQYRNGLALMYATQVYRLTRDRDWLRQVQSRLLSCAEWIFQARHLNSGSDSEFAGLLPRHAYGGDVHTPAYSIYSNATCWRGLQDAAYLLAELGESQSSRKFADDAARYRETIERVVGKFANREVKPPFVPMALDIGTPGEEGYRKVESAYSFIPGDPLGNYWILFAPLMLETGVFPADSTYSRWITDFMEQRGGLLAGLARFYRGVDHIYGFAYPLQLYDRADRRRFLATVYSVLAHGNSRDSFTSPEVAGVFPLRTDNETWREAFRRTVWDWDLYGRGWMHEDFEAALGAEPLSAGAGMALQLLRKMVLNEALDQNGQPTGTLDVLKLSPSHWLEDGKRIELTKIPTFFGKVSLQVRSQLSQKRIAGWFEPAFDRAPKNVVLWLRPPGLTGIKALTLNGKKVEGFSTDSFELPVSGRTEFQVEFQ
ncbi:MAG: hypothetical protein AB1898_27030 [Acidobacteriota bacterium]